MTMPLQAIAGFRRLYVGRARPSAAQHSYSPSAHEQDPSERRWGGGGDDPTEDAMRSALAELDAHDPEHPDCWLSDLTGKTGGDGLE